MADYRERAEQFQRAGFAIVTLSVDEPRRTASLRESEQLPFVMLCDVERRVVREWDLYNAREKGGIAVPATFVLDGERRVLLASVDGVRHRADADEVLAFARGEGASAGRRVISGTWLRAFRNIVRHGVISPRK